MDEDQEQRIDMELLVYGTRASKDKSGAYLFLPDDQAKVPGRPGEVSITELAEGHGDCSLLGSCLLPREGGRCAGGGHSGAQGVGRVPWDENIS